jgi:hypothetical protein
MQFELADVTTSCSCRNGATSGTVHLNVDSTVPMRYFVFLCVCSHFQIQEPYNNEYEKQV